MSLIENKTVRAEQALQAFQKKLSESGEVYTHIPLTLITQIHDLGKAHPILYSEVRTLLEGLKTRSIVQETSRSSFEGILFLQTYLGSFIHSVTNREFEGIQKFLAKIDQSEVAETTLTILLQNQDRFIHSPSSFIDQINNLYEMGGILNLEEKHEILDILSGLLSFKNPTLDTPSNAHEEKITRLKQIAKKIHDANAVPYNLSPLDQGAIKSQILQIHDEYKRSLLSPMSHINRLALYYQKTIPITTIDASAALALLHPDGRDLNPDDPREIPRLFQSDVLNENSLGKTRAFNYIYVFKKPNTSSVTISFPETRNNALGVIREASLLARKVMPENATTSEVLRMRNHILSMCTQHPGNMLASPLLVPLNLSFFRKDYHAALAISRSTISFDVVTKNGIRQQNQFKVTYEALLHLVKTPPDISDLEAKSIKEYCLSLPSFGSVTSNFIIRMDYDEGSEKWKVSASDIDLQYSLKNYLTV